MVRPLVNHHFIEVCPSDSKNVHFLISQIHVQDQQTITSLNNAKKRMH